MWRKGSNLFLSLKKLYLSNFDYNKTELKEFIFSGCLKEKRKNLKKLLLYMSIMN